MGNLFDEGDFDWKDCQTLGVDSVVNFKTQVLLMGSKQ